MTDAPVLVGNSPKIRSVLRILEKIVPTDSAVLILGESGTGKELVARYIHEQSARGHKPLISVNCSAFNETTARK
jgi:sigma-54-specific transcriptional regulator